MTPTNKNTFPRCLHLRTKMDYITHDEDPSGLSGGENDTPPSQDGGGHYCLHTMTVIGPDDDIVGARVCAPGRICYESPGF